jgi:hypothetical protein
VRTRDGVQIVFVDTPGFHRPRTLLGERLNRMVVDSAGDADVVVLVVDVLGGDALLPQLEAASRLAAFDHVIPVSPDRPRPRRAGRRADRGHARRPAAVPLPTRSPTSRSSCGGPTSSGRRPGAHP